MDKEAWALAGLGAGVGYYALSEKNQADSNRSYTASAMTDVLAFIGSGYVAWKGWTLNEGTLVGVGATIFSIHVMQVVFHKGWNTWDDA